MSQVFSNIFYSIATKFANKSESLCFILWKYLVSVIQFASRRLTQFLTKHNTSVTLNGLFKISNIGVPPDAVNARTYIYILQRRFFVLDETDFIDLTKGKRLNNYNLGVTRKAQKSITWWGSPSRGYLSKGSLSGGVGLYPGGALSRGGKFLPLNRMTDLHLWKHNLAQKISFGGCKYGTVICLTAKSVPDANPYTMRISKSI